MMNIDMWYGNAPEEATFIDCQFYPNSGVYRGNLWKDGRAIGDYSSSCSIEILNRFSFFFGG